ncbi:hypothetical protein GCM10008959_25590 [Deinococcus seoulensis]|uniref:Uncharacterized protein n=1 Tax=Deinococcus seoulensis TaxID=1837379 RepID=A0ABQ2RSB0_9DEIO|nr:hypothetical protein [Deinococcus seoulensis]GGR62477.1 hypothetical protein GCM10008959_25590 [Deinococcus seoulensis]
MPRRKTSIPKYIDEIPDGLATRDQLKAAGLQPGQDTPAALVELNTPNSQLLTGLFERAAAVPLDQEDLA